MAAVMAALAGTLALAIPAGGIAYVVVFALVERRFAPADLEFVTGLVRGRMPRRLAKSAG
jgi:hypothetical protein